MEVDKHRKFKILSNENALVVMTCQGVHINTAGTSTTAGQAEIHHNNMVKFPLNYKESGRERERKLLIENERRNTPCYIRQSPLPPARRLTWLYLDIARGYTDRQLVNPTPAGGVVAYSLFMLCERVNYSRQ